MNGDVEKIVKKLLAEDNRQAWDSHAEIPEVPGLCAIFFKPSVSPVLKNMRDDGLIYIGTSKNIRGRLKTHFDSLSADMSTLRWSLGALLKEKKQLSLQPIPLYRSGQKHYAFEKESEELLSEWMQHSLFYAYVTVGAYVNRDGIKSRTIESLRPLLNIESNKNVLPELIIARRKCKNEADGFMSLDLLEKWIEHSDLSLDDKLRLIVDSLDTPCRSRDIKERSKETGFSEIQKVTNLSHRLGKVKGLINIQKGWELNDTGKELVSYVKENLSSADNPNVALPLKKIAGNLGSLSKKMTDLSARSFLETAISCCRYGLHKPAILSFWVAAIYILRCYVLKNYPENFDEKAKKQRSSWKHAKSINDFSKLTDAVFLDTLCATGIISNGVKNKLHQCRKSRNACAHPDEVEFDDSMVTVYIKVLYLNVFTKFPC